MTDYDSAEVVKAMVNYITRCPGTTFGELENIAAELGVPVEGELSLEPTPNGVLWAGISTEFADIIDKLRATNQVEVHPLSPLEALLVHGFDGKALNLPVAQGPPRTSRRAMPSLGGWQ
jgi:hypothetical protein